MTLLEPLADIEHQLSRAGTKSGDLQRACYDLLCQHDMDGAIPTNGRFIYYELVQAGVIPKKYPGKRQPKDDISDALTRLRERGIIPWSWIVDETRRLNEWAFAETVRDVLLDEIGRARIDLWDGDPAPMIICESRSCMGVLRDLCSEYLVPLTATNGQCGGFLRTDVAPLLYGNRRVLYVGDLELRGPGEQIENNTRRVLAEAAGRDDLIDDVEDAPADWKYANWQRIALTQKQVDDDPRLTSLVITKEDTRYKPPKEYEAVECETLGQRHLIGIVRDKLDELLPEPLDIVLAREAKQREQMRSALKRIGGKR